MDYQNLKRMMINKRKITWTLKMLVFLFATGISAQDISGSWKGELDVKCTKMEMSFNITETNGPPHEISSSVYQKDLILWLSFLEATQLRSFFLSA